MEKIQPSLNVRTRQHNIVIRVPMLKNHAKAIGDKPEVEDVWKLFFTDNIMQKIVLETNKKITQMKENYKNKNLPFLQSMDEIELKALIGILAFSSVSKQVTSQFTVFSQPMKLEEMFSDVPCQKRDSCSC